MIEQAKMIEESGSLGDYLVPSPDVQVFCEKGYRECILIGQRKAERAWEEAHVVVMLIRRKCGYAQRVGIADMSESSGILLRRPGNELLLSYSTCPFSYQLIMLSSVLPKRHVKYN